MIKVLLKSDTTNYNGALDKEDKRMVIPSGTVLELETVPVNLERLISLGAAEIQADAVPADDDDLDPDEELLSGNVENTIKAITEAEKQVEGLAILLEKEKAGKNRKGVIEFLDSMLIPAE